MARARQATTFGELAPLIGMNPAFPLPVAGYLNPIAAFCYENELPLLPALVLRADGHIPEGLVAWLQRFQQTLPEAQETVFDFDFDWYDIFPPTPEEFVAAGKQAPG
jgi:putative restriction endonuclease